ncbi:MAG: hypothetical protein E6713_04585 [Sporomusaceae bacterium]|nr:hypothetical protein [Sporomusaceae bacterium]
MLQYLAQFLGRCECCGRKATRRLEMYNDGQNKSKGHYYCESCLSKGLNQAVSGEFLATGKKFTLFHSANELERAGIACTNFLQK